MSELVTEVLLVAIQEEPTAVDPASDWFVRVAPPAGVFSYKSTIATIGSIIAEQIGTAINRPDRVYRPGFSLPAGASIENDPDPLSPTFGEPTIIKDPYLNQLDYSVHLRGIEYLVKGLEWQNDIEDGGFRYTDGRTVTNGQVITVSFKPQISDAITIPDAVARFVDSASVYVVSASTTLGSAARRKLILVEGATADAVTITLDVSYPDGVLCYIKTTNGLNKQTIIQPPAGQTMYLGAEVSYVVAGQCEHVFATKVDGVWYVDMSDDWKLVGQTILGGVPGPNRVVANGQTLNISEVPRVDDYLTKLNTTFPGSVVSIAAWATNRTKWARGDTTIIVPDYGGDAPRFLSLGNGKDPDRGVNGSILGSRQLNQNKAHDHSNGAGTDAFNQLLRIPPPSDSNGTITVFDPPSAGNQPDLRVSAPLVSDGGIEARPDNIGFPAIICI